MKRLKPWLLPVMSLLTATALTALRQWQLSTAFDTDGVLISGRPATWALLAAVAVSALLWALGSRALAPCQALSSRRQMLPGLLTLLGALAIVCGSAMSLYWDLHQREILALAAGLRRHYRRAVPLRQRGRGAARQIRPVRAAHRALSVSDDQAGE